MMPSDTVCPRSGWATMSASAITAAGTSGISISRSDARSMRRAASRCAPQIANAILASSDGCMEKPGDDEPAAGSVGLLADSRDEHQDQQHDGDREAGEREAAHGLHAHPHRGVEREQADQRPDQLLAEDHPRRAVLVVGVHARGRQHHDQAQRGEQRGDGDDEVERRHRPAEPCAEARARDARPTASAAVAARPAEPQPGQNVAHRPLPGCAHGGGEGIPALGVAAELVEGCARGGQQHGVACAGQPARRGNDGGHQTSHRINI